MAITGVGDHQSLHEHGVFFHEIGDAGIGIDDQLVSQPHLAPFVVFFDGQKLLAEGPVMVIDRQAATGISVHHLLGRDDLNLVGVGIEAKILGDAGDFRIKPFKQGKGPFGTGGDWFIVTHPADAFFLNNSRKTG